MCVAESIETSYRHLFFYFIHTAKTVHKKVSNNVFLRAYNVHIYLFSSKMTFRYISHLYRFICEPFVSSRSSSSDVERSRMPTLHSVSDRLQQTNKNCLVEERTFRIPSEIHSSAIDELNERRNLLMNRAFSCSLSTLVNSPEVTLERNAGHAQDETRGCGRRKGWGMDVDPSARREDKHGAAADPINPGKNSPSPVGLRPH